MPTLWLNRLGLLPLLFIASGVFAQTVTQQQTLVFDSMHAELSARCAEFVPSLIADAELLPALAARPIDTKSVCSCAVQTMRRENRLIKMIESNRPIAESRKEEIGKQISAYMLLLYLQSMLGCLAADMEQSSKTSPIAE